MKFFPFTDLMEYKYLTWWPNITWNVEIPLKYFIWFLAFPELLLWKWGFLSVVEMAEAIRRISCDFWLVVLEGPGLWLVVQNKEENLCSDWLHIIKQLIPKERSRRLPKPVKHWFRCWHLLRITLEDGLATFRMLILYCHSIGSKFETINKMKDLKINSLWCFFANIITSPSVRSCTHVTVVL